ncbi:MAG: hypothetical protein KC502_23580 [Myxococcales bacterium]|nr:hypothetical protein [Myxococcales bacterium]
MRIAQISPNRLRRLAKIGLCASLALSLTACLAKEEKGDTPDASATDGATADGTSDAGPAPTTFVPKCETDAKCKSVESCIEGVCVPNPGKDDKTQLGDPTEDNGPTSEAINLECVGKDLDEVIGSLPKGKKATMWGRVDRFGGGPVTTDVEVAIFLAADFHPENCAGIEDPADSQACFASDKVGKPFATVISLDPDAVAKKGWDVTRPKKADEECNKGKHLECPHGYVCDKIDGFPKCGKGHGVFAVDDIPLNTRLVVRTRASKADDPAGWHDTYTYNVVLFSTHMDVKGAGTQPTGYEGKDTVLYNPTIVGEGQWQLVPSTIGIVGGIYEGDGVIGGRIRDCGTKDRRSWPITDARVGIGHPPEGMSYFNDSELDPVPNKSRVTTNIVGRYAAVGVPPGPNRVAVRGKIAGKATTLGVQDVYVIPNALVIASLPGYIPHWNK